MLIPGLIRRIAAYASLASDNCGRSLQSSVKALEDISALDATFAIAFLSFDTANRERITEHPGLLAALVKLIDPNVTDTDSTFADEHDLVVRFSLSAISQLALDKRARVALCNERNAIRFIFARALNESREVYIRMTAMIALSNLLLEPCVCESFLADRSSVNGLVTIASTVPVVTDAKRKSSATLLLDYALNALYHLTSSPAWASSKFAIDPDAQQRILDIASGNPQFQAVFLADRVASCIDPLRALNHPEGSSAAFSFHVLPGPYALGDVANGVGGFFSEVFAKTKSGLSSVGDATGISKVVDAAATGLDKAKATVTDAVHLPAAAPPSTASASEGSSGESNPFARAFDAVKSGVTAIGDKVVDVAKAGADVAKSGVSAAADATSAGLSKAADAAKAGADAAKSAASAAASSVPGISNHQQDATQAPRAAAPVVPDLKNGPSVKALAEKFVVAPKAESPRLRSSSRERPATFAQLKESHAPSAAPASRMHTSGVYDVPSGAGSDVYHC